MEIFMSIAMIVLFEILIFLITDSWTVVIIGAVDVLILFLMYVSLYLIINKKRYARCIKRKIDSDQNKEEFNSNINSDTEESNNIKTCYYCGRKIGDPFRDLNDLDDGLHQFPNKNEKCCLFCHILVTQTNYYLKDIINNPNEEERLFEELKLHITAVQIRYMERKRYGY